MNIFEQVDLSIDPNLIGIGPENVSPQRLIQFVKHANDHICPSKGYLFSALPTINELCINIRTPALKEELAKALLRLNTYRVPQTTAAILTKIISLDPANKEKCPLFTWLNALPPTHTHFRIPFSQIEALIKPSLELTTRLLFIDRYLELKPGDDDTQRLLRWANGAISLAKLSIVRQYIPDHDAFLNSLNSFAKMLPPHIHARVFALSDKGKAAFHGRYIHTDQFTVGIEAGLDKENKQNKKTDVYLLGRDGHWDIDAEFITSRDQYFKFLDAWEKKPDSDCFKHHDKSIPTFSF